jgi:phytanoyl-CoA hydroxylase
MTNSTPEFSPSSAELMRQEYNRDGYIKFPAVIPHDEALELGVELQQLIKNRNKNVQWDGDFIDDVERAKTKIFDMHEVQVESPNFEALRHDPRILGRLAVLLGGPVIYHHNKGFVKPGVHGDTYGGKFPPHQDYPFFPHYNYNMLATIIYMTDITDDMGPVKIFPGSHADGPRQTAEGRPYINPDEFPAEDAITMTGKAGDMVAFNINTVHMSGPNKSLTDRVSWLMQVTHPDSKPLNNHREPYQGERLWD